MIGSCCLMLCVFIVAGDTEELNLLGTWESVSITREGKRPNEKVALEFREKTLDFRFASNEIESYEYVLRMGRSFSYVELFARLDGEQVLAARGIVSLSNGLLNLCLSIPGGDDSYPYPREFSATPGSDQIVYVLKLKSKD